MAAGPGRTCGDCTLCCRLLPVRDISKPGWTRCLHQSRQGCSIHGTPMMPACCSAWACWWLARPDAKLPRPDRAHYVVDVIPDTIRVGDGGEEATVMVMQVWADPAYPDAHRDPKLRAFIVETGVPAIVRFATFAILLAPPKTKDEPWVELVAPLQSGAGVGRWSHVVGPRIAKGNTIEGAEDAIDSQIARVRLADLNSGKTRIVSGADLEARLAAMMDE